MDGFELPDFDAPLDLEALVAAAPEDGTTKGMYLSALIAEVKNADKQLAEPRSYIGFRDYPLREYMRLNVEVAGLLYPDLPVREGLRRLGRQSYQTFVDSMIGRVIMGVLGKSIVRVTNAVGKAYRVSGDPGDAEVLEVDETHSLVRLREVYAFVDCMQVGVFEGAFAALGYEPTIRVKKEGPATALLRSEYRKLG